MDFLSEIIALKTARLNAAKANTSFGRMRELAFDLRAKSEAHFLRERLSRPGLNVIAEIKRASPSLGSINPDADPAKIACEYEGSGAAAISVLTEEDRFKGSMDDLRSVKSVVKIPVLRKDFIFEEYQAYESAAAGADALLRI